MKKLLTRIAIILAVLIVVAVIVVGLFLGAFVKKALETIGPKITQVSVKVDAVDLSLLTGSAKVKGLVVGNPEGYQTAHAISVGSAAVGVDPFSVLSDKIVIRSVRVEAPEITFEGSLFSGNNLGKIMQNVNSAGKGGGPAATNATPGTPNKPAQKIEVDDFLITGAKVSFNGVNLTLPDIHLTNLGAGSDGITATDLTRRLLDALTTATFKAVAANATEIGKNFGQNGQNLGKSLGSSLTNVTKGLGGLFKK